MNWKSNWRVLGVFGVLGVMAACGGDSTGDARILVSSEDSIVSGLEPGTGEEDIADGWTITFDSYVLTIGNVSLGRSGDGSIVNSDDVVILDLRDVGTGVDLALFESIDAGRWDQFSFETPAATAETPCDANVSEADCEAARSLGLTYLIRGTMSRVGGESCPPGDACRPAESIDFELAVAAPILYSSCESDGLAGIAVPESGQSNDSIWIHGDHLFFNVFGGDEGTVIRRAQWLANADLDGNDFVDMDELAGIGLSDFPELFTEFTETYSFTGSPITITTAADFVVAQLSTQGHLNGEGECTPTPL